MSPVTTAGTASSSADESIQEWKASKSPPVKPDINEDLKSFQKEISEAIMAAAQINSNRRGSKVDEYQKYMEMMYKVEDKIDEF